MREKRDDITFTSSHHRRSVLCLQRISLSNHTLRPIEQSLWFFSPQSKYHPKHPDFEETCTYFILLQLRQICGLATGGVCGAMRLVQKRRNVFPWPKKSKNKHCFCLFFLFFFIEQMSDFIIAASFLLIHVWNWSLKFRIFLYIQRKLTLVAIMVEKCNDCILMLSMLSKNTQKKKILVQAMEHTVNCNNTCNTSSIYIVWPMNRMQNFIICPSAVCFSTVYTVYMQCIWIIHSKHPSQMLPSLI